MKFTAASTGNQHAHGVFEAGGVRARHYMRLASYERARHDGQFSRIQGLNLFEGRVSSHTAGFQSTIWRNGPTPRDFELSKGTGGFKLARAV